MERQIRIVTLLLCLVGLGLSIPANSGEQHEGAADTHAAHPPGMTSESRVNAPAGPFVIDSSKSNAELLGQSMAVMSRDMHAAPMTGDADHDFAAMMIPHHQGAIDMAKVELLYGKNPVLRRLAQEIVVTQRSEIDVLRMQLDRMREANVGKSAR
jgi:uncharacterized protein (DUF305 family)